MPLAPCSIFVGKIISVPGVLAKLFFRGRKTALFKASRPLPAPARPAPQRARASPHTAHSRAGDFFSKQLFASRRLLFISPPHRRVAHLRDPLLGNSSTVERRTLTPLILVRIQVPQPITSQREQSVGWLQDTATGTVFRVDFPEPQAHSFRPAHATRATATQRARTNLTVASSYSRPNLLRCTRTLRFDAVHDMMVSTKPAAGHALHRPARK